MAQIYVEASDGSLSNTVNVTREPDFITITTPTNGEVFAAGDTFTLAGTSSLVGQNIHYVVITDTGCDQGAITVDSSGNWTDGSFVISAAAARTFGIYMTSSDLVDETNGSGIVATKGTISSVTIDVTTN